MYTLTDQDIKKILEEIPLNRSTPPSNCKISEKEDSTRFI